MRINQKLASLALAGSVLFGLAGAASAASAVATGNVNVRSGPSAGYQRVGTLQTNQLVEVQGCRDGWCFIEKRGTDGWVSSRYLQAVRHQGPKPSVNFSFSFGSVPQHPRPGHNDPGNSGGWNDSGGANHGGHNNGPGWMGNWN